jgi:uncharacterized protein (DUF2062 family)
VRAFLQQRLVRPVLDLLTLGITPEKVALCVVFGVALGMFPVLGSTTLLCALAAVVFRLNLPAIQIVNYFVYPLQLALVVPFMRLGGIIFSGASVSLTRTQMLELFRADRLHAMKAFWGLGVQAVGAWSLVVPPLTVVAYLLLSRILRRAAARMELARGQANQPSAAGG